jgi:hypothetical protein
MAGCYRTNEQGVRLLRIALSGAALLAVVLAAVGQAKPDARRSKLLLGNGQIAAAADSDAAGRAEAFPFAGQRSGTATTLHLYVTGANRAKRIDIGLYADAHGRPGALLRAALLRRPAGGRWNRVGVRAVRIHAGRAYWIAVLGTGGTMAYRDAPSSSCHSQEAAQTRLKGVPERWRTGATWATCFASAYVSGKATGTKRVTSSPPPTPVPPPTTTPPPNTGIHNGCFKSPGSCGFPDPSSGNVGPSNSCASNPQVDSITTSRDGQTIANTTFTGQIVVQNNNVTINNVCVLSNGQSAPGSVGISILNGRNTVIQNSTIAGLDQVSRSLDWAVANTSGDPATLSHDLIVNCGECIHNGPWTINDTYANANGMQASNEHIETIYCDAGNGYTDAISANHDTLLAPNQPGNVSPVAVVFCNTANGGGGACSNQISITNSLLAGGGYVLYTCGNSSSAGSSAFTFTGNRIARCTSRACPDSSGYWPNGGENGVDSGTYCPPMARQIWSNNVWDDDGSSVGC